MGTHQELEMFGSQPAYPEKLLHKKESLQNQLINIRVELSQATTVTLRSHPLRRATPPSQGFPSPALPEGTSKLSGGLWAKPLKLPCKMAASLLIPSSLHQGAWLLSH